MFVLHVALPNPPPAVVTVVVADDVAGDVADDVVLCYGTQS